MKKSIKHGPYTGCKFLLTLAVNFIVLRHDQN